MKRHASMNRIYRLVWSTVHRVWIPVAEIARGRSKGSGRKLAAAALSLTAAVSHGEPLGGRIVSGSGSISQAGDTTTIHQTSRNLSANWQSFDVAPKETVNFEQPSAASIAVNRIADTDGTQILGHVNANGQVYLINPNGVVFGEGAEVNVGGIVASTLDLDDASLNSTTKTFKGGGRVINKGHIHATDGGYVALLGNKVGNKGVITAQLGTVALGAGSTVALTFSDNSLVQMQVKQSTLNNLAENKQLIRADGGRVFMTAGARDSLLASVVNNTGVIEARSVENHNGVITLLGGMATGTVNVGGTLDASQIPPASSFAKGGNDIPAPSAATGENDVFVSPAAQGGQRVSPIPAKEAQGVPPPFGKKGQGGFSFVETSAAHVHVANDAKITTQAPRGHSGTWLIDPVDFTIAATGGDMTGATLSSNLGAGNVVIQSTSGSHGGTAGDVNVNDAVTWNANKLTLNALNNINFNADLNGSGTASLSLQYGQASAAGGTSSYNLAHGARINLPAGSNFSTKLGSAGANKNYTVLTMLGADQNSTTATDLQGINGNLAGNYVLGADIDASATAAWNFSTGFTPIGNAGANFTGTFDGLGHTIGNLASNRYSLHDVGLFGVTGSSAVIRNVGLLGGSVFGGNGSVGSAGVGYSRGGAGGNGGNVGNLVGMNLGTISNSYATGSVSGGHGGYGGVGGNGGNNTGMGGNGNGGDGGSGGNLGGLVGLNLGNIRNSYATGGVSGAGGGDGGRGGNGEDGAYGLGGLGGLGGNVGGLVGSSSGTISASHAGGSVNGGIGGNGGWGTHYSSSGQGGGGGNVGGLAGFNTSSIGTSYATGNVNGGNGGNGGDGTNGHETGWNIASSDGGDGGAGGNAGGFVGLNWTGTISGSYASGNVAGGYGGNGGNGGAGYDISNTFILQKLQVEGIVFLVSTAVTWPMPGVGALAGGQLSAFIVSKALQSAIKAGLATFVEKYGNAQQYYASMGIGGANGGHGGVGGNAGGLAGKSTGTIDVSYAAGSVNGGSGGTGGGGGHGGNSASLNLGALGTLRGGDGAAAGYGGNGGNGGNVGGLVGETSAAIGNSYAAGNVSGGNGGEGGVGGQGGEGGVYIPSLLVAGKGGNGGIGGWGGDGGNAGGLAGKNSSTISTSYALGGVSGGSGGWGGLGGDGGTGGSGICFGPYCYGGAGNGASFGAGSGAPRINGDAGTVGGLLGLNDIVHGGSVDSSYWNISTSGQPASAGGTGLTSAQMMQTASFTGGLTGWNIAGSGGSGATWRIYEGHTAPLLASFLTPLTLSDAADVTVTYDGSPHSAATTGIAGVLGAAATATHAGTYNGYYSTQQGYDITGGTLTIAPKLLTLSGLTGLSGVDRAYDGSTVVDLSYSGSPVLSGLVGSETLTLFNAGGRLTGTLDSRNAGSRSVSVALADGTGLAGNYTLPTFGNVTISPRASVAWSGGASGNWSNAANWAGGAIPDHANVKAVTIPAGVTVTYDSGVAGATTLNTLSSSGDLVMAAGTLTVDGDLDTAGYRQIGGALSRLNVGGNMRVTQSFAKAAGATGSLALTGAGGTLAINQNAGDLTFYNDQPIKLGTVTAPGKITLGSSGDITFNGSVNAAGLTLQSQNYIVKAPINLPAGLTFTTADAAGGNLKNYTVITSLGVAGSTTGADLQGIDGRLGRSYAPAYYALGSDIDATATATWNAGAGFSPLGAGRDPNSSNGPFLGIFDGLGHSIGNLTIDRPTETNVGLFASLSPYGATVQNVGLTGGSVHGGANVGALVGYNNLGTVRHSHATADVNGNSDVGGLVGYNNGYISNSYATGNVTGSAGSFEIGGLAGFNYWMDGSYATGNVSGNTDVGGLAGYSLNVSNSYATGNVGGNTDVGGLVGKAVDRTWTSYATGNVSGNNNTGALIGRNLSIADSSYAGLAGSAQMQQQSHFAGFDFTNTWVMYEGHTTPLLRAFLTPLTVTATGNLSKTYDGLPSYSVGNGMSVSYSSTPDPAKLFGTLSGSSGSNVGSYAITPNSGLYSNQQGYLIGYGDGNGTLTINPANLTLSGTRSYDGTTTVAGNTLTAVGVHGETFSVTGAGDAGNLSSKNVQTGSTLSSVAGLSLGGSGNGGLAGNYNALSTAGSSFSITPAALALTGVSADKVYDGGTAATFTVTGTPAISGVIAGDSVTLGGSNGSGVFADKNAGTGKPVLVTGGYSLGGTDAGNYVLTSAADITPLTSVAWTGGASGNWSNPANWAGGAIPDHANVLAVTIAAGKTVTYDSGVEGATTLNTLSSGGNLLMAAGTLSTTGDLVTAGYSQSGGTLNVGGDMSVTQSFAKGSGASGSLRLTGNGSRLDIHQNTGDLLFYNDQAIKLGAVSAPGNLLFSTSSGDIDVDAPLNWSTNTLTLSAANNININADLNASGSAALALRYGQGAAAAGNSANYFLHGAQIGLPAGTANFTTRQGSNGVVKSYTVITGVDALQGMSGNLAGNYALGADIDATATAAWNAGAGFAPVGHEYYTGFTGLFDGLGHTIGNLTINRPTTNYVGLFGSTGSATIRNVGLTGADITGSQKVAALVGSNNGATIDNSYVTGSVRGDYSVGALVGDNSGMVGNSYATAAVSATAYGSSRIGGLVGANYNNSTVTNSYATGNVTTGLYSREVGGLVGQNYYYASVISNSYATGNVTAGAGSYHVGALLGGNHGGSSCCGTLSNSYAGAANSAPMQQQSTFAGFDFT
ncbi:MAG: filamentous hemagglutinin N-terminal domain-containing protein, partial [Methylococcaceae bacterium]